MRLAAFRRHTDEPHVPGASGWSSGDGDHWWLHPFPDGADLVELLAADARVAGVAADVAAAGRRPDPTRWCCCRRSTRSRCATSSPSRRTSTGMERGHGNPGPPGRVVRRAGLPVHGAARGHRAVRRRRDTRRTPSGSTSSSRSRRSSAATCRNVTPEGARDGDRRLLRDERLVRPRRPGPRDEAQARPLQGQGLRHHDRPLGRDRRRARRAAATTTASSTSRWRSASTACRSAATAPATWAGRSSSWSRTPRAPRG